MPDFDLFGMLWVSGKWFVGAKLGHTIREYRKPPVELAGLARALEPRSSVAVHIRKDAGQFVLTVVSVDNGRDEVRGADLATVVSKTIKRVS